MRAVPIVETSVSRSIRERIDLARATGENLLITGSAGVGKTWALEDYSTTNSHVHFITVPAVLGKSAVTMISTLCDCFGYWHKEKPALALRNLKTFIADWHSSLDHRPVVIFDEAQNIKLETLRDIQTLSDDRDPLVTLVFCGNDHVLNVVNSRRSGFDQIGRRIQHRLQLNHTPDDDVNLIAAAHGVDADDAMQMARMIGTEFHAAGVVTVLKAARCAAGTGNAIKASHIREALELFPQYRTALRGKAAARLG